MYSACINVETSGLPRAADTDASVAGGRPEISAPTVAGVGCVTDKSGMPARHHEV